MIRLSGLSLPLLIGLAGCAQVLGLGDYQEGAGGTGHGGNGTSSTGEGGSAPKPCEKDADCTNGLFCDGVEHCGDDNFCSAGTPPCPVPSDSAHCVTPCTEATAAAVCGAVAAKDGDGDMHGDPLCAAAPGDDCDDTNPARFPGNPEVCDAVDNDCNSEVDDGLPATGGSVEIGGSDAYTNSHVAFSPGLGVYGTAYVLSVQDPDLEVVFSGHDGVATGSFQVASFINQGISDVRPRIAANDSEFAVVWHDEDDINSGIFLTLVSPAGVIQANISVSTFNHQGISPDVVATPSGDFIVVWANPMAANNVWVLAQRVLADGTLSGNAVTIVQGTPAIEPRIARSGNNYAVAWRDVDGGGNPVNSGRAFDDSFNLGSIVPLSSSTLGDHAITAHGTGFAFAWHEPGDLLGLALLDPSLGSTASSTAVSDVRGGLAIATSGSEVLVLESASNTAPEPIARIHRFDDTATSLGPPLQVSESNLIDSETGFASIVATSLGVVVVWDNVFEQIDTVERVMFRGMGKNLCD